MEVAVLLLSGNLDGTSIEYTITTSPGTATGQSIYIPSGTEIYVACVNIQKMLTIVQLPYLLLELYLLPIHGPLTHLKSLMTQTLSLQRPFSVM